MIRILVSGCNGHMGHVVCDCIAARTDCAVAAGLDLVVPEHSSFPVFTKPEDITAGVDVIIDFSHPSVLSPLLAYAVKNGIPAVLCTTGYSKEQVEEIKEASKKIPVFYSRNMSLGINLLIELSKKAAQVLGPQFDIEIVEKHHNQKIDAPSGTALMLADGISSVLSEEPHYVYDRHSQRKKRDPNEIGIHSVRGGTIVGEHEVIFAGRHEVITLAHSAQSKEVFANGAVNAAVYLANQKPGLYDMSDLLK
ncbi:MAG TPA: 4-hydroxy-tetrahydrodipicolinate reductase [Candidatus Gallacutalibacter pullicola]|uniref:4-hydroxy-tetrahydrodipicolinate reductase n=2 Tax=Eubacteriales TaxID=186802 RepID=A0A9D1J0P6_9FIRM|nr:4-hydroxy-tetrahydrodipicolinate reductase [Candidatus Gallacutalibacter pullicola]HIU29969.1 4-hydroxy-tetrahydrodipicolinate reductase [Candidatus Egerieisoma faecipullorum]